MLFFGVWSEIAALFERLTDIHSNPSIAYYGFKVRILSFVYLLYLLYFPALNVVNHITPPLDVRLSRCG